MIIKYLLLKKQDVKNICKRKFFIFSLFEQYKYFIILCVRYYMINFFFGFSIYYFFCMSKKKQFITINKLTKTSTISCSTIIKFITKRTENADPEKITTKFIPII
ncbi:hypothetical protein EDEG_02535 [Edhazardia aedis USNM 41457]|uniref:Uncharacterized protein n=1 Tax=Edhazardia aedis (strain USNM 41457) TaxID=1003232 RepID=J8ZTW3_EDHAE|nr:hypothetical protein EDEG_02535 [Edhazardia aedis USNM 41457]|eukprot:EJW03083.1 hypothetical protein EDEG_02535 [Edhazardia aedis USNM 41457]